MRYSIIDLNSCDRHEFRSMMVLNTTSNPIISYIDTHFYSGYNSTQFKYCSMNCMKPYQTNKTTNSGVTIEPINDGSYHIYGTCSTANKNIVLYQFDNTCFDTKSTKVYFKYEITTSQSGTSYPLSINTNPLTDITNQSTILLSEMTNASWNYVYFNPVKDTEYDFYIKIWTTLPDYLNSDNNGLGDYYLYMAPTYFATPTSNPLNGAGYNILLPKKCLNMPLVIYSSSYNYRGATLYYNPRYEFNYKTFNEEMDLLNIPMYVRPFAGYTQSSAIPFPEYPVKGFRYVQKNGNAAVLNAITQGDYAVTSYRDFDGILEYGDSRYHQTPNSSYAGTTQNNSYNFGTTPSNILFYEWILGDPPLVLAED